jgi:hypothetical protein
VVTVTTGTMSLSVTPTSVAFGDPVGMTVTAKDAASGAVLAGLPVSVGGTQVGVTGTAFQAPNMPIATVTLTVSDGLRAGGSASGGTWLEAAQPSRDVPENVACDGSEHDHHADHPKRLAPGHAGLPNARVRRPRKKGSHDCPAVLLDHR